MEVEELLERWIRGTADESELDRLSGVLAEDFRIVADTDQVLTASELVDYLCDQRGKDPATRRWVENLRLADSDPRATVVVYDEWQIRDGKRIGNLVRVVFGEAPDAPNGVRLLHVQETPLDT